MNSIISGVSTYPLDRHLSCVALPVLKHIFGCMLVHTHTINAMPLVQALSCVDLCSTRNKQWTRNMQLSNCSKACVHMTDCHTIIFNALTHLCETRWQWIQQQQEGGVLWAVPQRGQPQPGGEQHCQGQTLHEVLVLCVEEEALWVSNTRVPVWDSWKYIVAPTFTIMRWTSISTCPHTPSY